MSETPALDILADVAVREDHIRKTRKTVLELQQEADELQAKIKVLLEKDDVVGRQSLLQALARLSSLKESLNKLEVEVQKAEQDLWGSYRQS